MTAACLAVLAGLLLPAVLAAIGNHPQPLAAAPLAAPIRAPPARAPIALGISRT
jgi:hypothetical protein